MKLNSRSRLTILLKLPLIGCTTFRRVAQSEAKNPPQASRIYAYAAIGLYEAVVPGITGNRSLEGQIPDLANLPKSSSFGKLDFIIAANEALYQISTKVFGTIKPANLAR